MEIRTVLPSNGLATIFSTNRYYDLLSQTAPWSQMIVGGVVYPMVRFFPRERTVLLPDDRAVLSTLRDADPAFPGELLFIEAASRPPRPGVSRIDLRDANDIKWYYSGSFDADFAQLLSYLLKVREAAERNLGMEDAAVGVVGNSVNEIAVAVENQTAGYLLFSDGYSGYWRAYDNGRPIPVLAANYNSKAVFLPKGSHSVRFAFDPVHYRFALYMYYTGLLICPICMVLLWRKETKVKVKGARRTVPLG